MKSNVNCFTKGYLVKSILVMKMFVFFIIAFSLQASASGQKISVSQKNAPLKEIFGEIEKKSEYLFIYETGTISSEMKATVTLHNVEVEDIVKKCLENYPLSYSIVGKNILVRKKQITTSVLLSTEAEIPKSADRTITGTVTDTTGNPVEGVSVYLKNNESKGTTTNSDGRFILTIPTNSKTIVFNHVGYEKVEMNLNDRSNYLVRMKPKLDQMDDLVITGIYTRKKESFTGSSSTYTGVELKEIGVQNVIQSLSVLDPAFTLLENNQFGSDPNRLPDLEIRGKSSIVGLKEQFGEDPNQPLFILDGFETSLQTIMDISMDRIASVTVLKDAASTAIYGAKAANGVVVIETKLPERGKIRVSYSGSTDVSFPDLTDYNLMNAEEKLEFEMKSGRFKSNLSTVEEERMHRYYGLLQEVKRGVNTYWLAEPLRTGVNQRNSIYLEGGDREMRYGLGVNNRTVQGVMKNSKRDNLSGNIDLIYRRGKISFMNKFTVDQMNNRNPIVPFSDYSRANPYYRKNNEKGGVDKWLEHFNDYQSASVPNPLWDDALNSKDVGKSFGVRNNLNAEYRPYNFLTIRGRAGINKSNSETEVFYSPDATRFDNVELLRKGTYRNSASESVGFEGDFTVTYGQVFSDVHLLNIVAGTSLNQRESITKGFDAEGFPEGNFTTPAFSNRYPEGGKPSYSDSKARSVGFFMNTGYAFKSKYLLDLNLRSDGTSVFGSNRLFSTTWSAGVAWNIHQERFMNRYADEISMLKIRASIGNPGNQNFGSFNSITTYKFNNWLQNNFGTGLIIDKFGDPDLEWQKTLDRNIGIDISILRNRLHVNFDYYHKRTDPLMAFVGTPLSVGTANRLMNVGMQINKGYHGTARYAILYKPQQRINWTTSVSFRSNKAYYDKIGNRLDAHNRENISKNLARYYNGGSPTALWSVRSKGIDPASGREIFINKAGENVFGYSYNDEVVVGDTRPLVEGVFGNTFMYKGFSASLHIRYSYGGDIFNNTLYSKVENISSSEIVKNQDRRALYNRWQHPGDIAQFKGISLTEFTPISSRFVQENNYISIESVRVGYDVFSNRRKKAAISSLQLNAYMNEIGRIATVKTERGIDYPFARTISLSISATF